MYKVQRNQYTRYRNLLSNLTHRRQVRHTWNLHPRVLHYVLCYVLFSLYNLYILYRLQVYIYILYIYIIHTYPYTNGERDTCTCVRAHVFVCLRMSFLIFPCAYSVCMYPRNRMHCHWSSWDLHTMCSCFSAYGILWVHLHGTCRLPLVTSHASI